MNEFKKKQKTKRSEKQRRRRKKNRRHDMWGNSMGKSEDKRGEIRNTLWIERRQKLGEACGERKCGESVDKEDEISEIEDRANGERRERGIEKE